MRCPPASTNARGPWPKGRGPHLQVKRRLLPRPCFRYRPCGEWPAARRQAVRHLNRLTETEAAYVAGIIDGEGTVTLTRTHRGENRRPVVSISSTELPLLAYVRGVVGAGRINSKARARAYHSPSFTYCISSRQALSLLEQVSP